MMVLAFWPGVPGSNPVQILYFFHAFIHLFLCYGLCWYDSFLRFIKSGNCVAKGETIHVETNIFNKRLTLSQTTNLRLFQPEVVCRWQFQIWWKMQKVLKTSIENTVGKGEIACFKQFLHFPHWFQNTCTADM